MGSFLCVMHTPNGFMIYKGGKSTLCWVRALFHFQHSGLRSRLRVFKAGNLCCGKQTWSPCKSACSLGAVSVSKCVYTKHRAFWQQGEEQMITRRKKTQNKTTQKVNLWQSFKQSSSGKKDVLHICIWACTYVVRILQHISTDAF